MDLTDALRTFAAESRGLLQEMEDALMRLEREPADEEAIHAVFRAAHTIKGSAGLFAMDDIVGFTHHVESLLVRVRDGDATLDKSMAALLLECADHIGRLLQTQEQGMAVDAATADIGHALVQRLAAQLGQPWPVGTLAVADGDAAPLQRTALASDPADDVWHISLRFGTEVLRNGLDPASFIRHLRTLGRIVHIATLADALPPLAALDAEQCHLGFEIRLASSAGKAELEAAFDFVRDDCSLCILPPDSRVDAYVALIEALPEERQRLGELLVAAGAVTEGELAAALREQARQHATDAAPVQPLGRILVQAQQVQPELVQAALERQSELRQRQSQEARLIRVQADKLDALIDRVGELVIASAAVGMLAGRNRDRALGEAVSSMSRLTEDVRDGAMRLRMVEIGETFGRFRRVVRDVSRELDKDIEFAVRGGETELDKSVVERIGDPLTHLVRNAIDHGIEPPAQRLAQGKPARGRLELVARHEAGFVVIEVRDDGRGLDRARILAKARERGLVAPGQEPTDEQVWNLIFEAGFSTADQVSKLSGRGVGMDVVRRDIEALRGSVEIDSRAGRGTTFRIRLPLTLAIIDGFLMGVGDSRFVVPLDMVLECVQFEPGRFSGGSCDCLDLRGEVLPLLRIREHFELETPRLRRENVVVVQMGQRKAGLVVDRLEGQFQAVIKPLGSLLRGLDGITGSTILASGEVALVLDVSALLDQATRRADAAGAYASAPT